MINIFCLNVRLNSAKVRPYLLKPTKTKLKESKKDALTSSCVRAHVLENTFIFRFVIIIRFVIGRAYVISTVISR